MAFFLFIAIRLSNNKDKKTEEVEIGSKIKLALAVYFVKDFVNDMVTVISKKVYPWFYSK